MSSAHTHLIPSHPILFQSTLSKLGCLTVSYSPSPYITPRTPSAVSKRPCFRQLSNYNIQHTTYNVQHTTYNIQFTIYTSQHTQKQTKRPDIQASEPATRHEDNENGEQHQSSERRTGDVCGRIDQVVRYDTRRDDTRRLDAVEIG